jgi:HD-GYP domain-containing protein (c-di-GMP phosphodiesterase class II)
VYDALTSSRVYKPAMPHAKALDMITSGSGAQFDPAVVEALVQCEIVFHLAGQQFKDDLPEAEPRSKHGEESP